VVVRDVTKDIRFKKKNAAINRTENAAAEKLNIPYDIVPSLASNIEDQMDKGGWFGGKTSSATVFIPPHKRPGCDDFVGSMSTRPFESQPPKIIRPCGNNRNNANSKKVKLHIGKGESIASRLPPHKRIDDESSEKLSPLSTTSKSKRDSEKLFFLGV
jgi:hypothetical protein